MLTIRIYLWPFKIQIKWSKKKYPLRRKPKRKKVEVPGVVQATMFDDIIQEDKA